GVDQQPAHLLVADDVLALDALGIRRDRLAVHVGEAAAPLLVGVAGERAAAGTGRVLAAREVLSVTTVLGGPGEAALRLIPRVALGLAHHHPDAGPRHPGGHQRLDGAARLLLIGVGPADNGHGSASSGRWVRSSPTWRPYAVVTRSLGSLRSLR